MITENRIINRKNLKQLCIDLDLYTLGTSEEYEEMLKSAVFEEHLTTYRAKPYWKAAKSIEILTVETKTYIEKTQETIK